MINSIEYQANEHMTKAFEIVEDFYNPFRKGTEEYWQYEQQYDKIKTELYQLKNRLMLFIHIQTREAIFWNVCEADAQHDFEKELI